MSDQEKISSGVKRLARTRRAQLVLDYLVRGLFWGAIPAALAIFAGKLWLLPVEPLWLAGGLLAAITLGFTIAGALRRLTPLAVANEIDVRLGLRERVSSALALGTDARRKDPFVKALLHDAAKAVEKAQLKRVFPWRVPQAWRIAVPALLIAAALSFLPQLGWFVHQSDRAEAQQVQNQGQKLKELAKQLKKESEKKKDPVLKKQAVEVKRTGEKLDRPNVKKKEALKELQKLKDKLEAQQKAQVPQGEKELTAKLSDELTKLKSTQELGQLLKDGKTGEFGKQLQDMLKNLQAGKLSDEQMKTMQDLVQALEQTLKSNEAGLPDAQELKKQLEQLKQALQNTAEMKSQLAKTLGSLQKDLKDLTSNMQQNQMSQPAQQLSQQMQQMMQEFTQNGTVNQQTVQQMQQALQQTQQQIQNSQKLSQQQKQQLGQQCQKCQNYFEGKDGQQGKQGQQGKSGQQGKQGQPGQGGEGSIGQMSDQLAQAMQQMGQMAQQQGQGMGSQPGQGGSLSGQIEGMKMALGMGQYMQGTQGTAASGQGWGSTPYAVAPAPAPAGGKSEDRMNSDKRDTAAKDFQGMYAPQDFAHSAHDEQVHGKLDLTKPPQKVEEVRSAPENQEALAQYSGAISAYTDGQEQAIQREQVPLEYQDLVRQYFDELKKSEKKSEAKDKPAKK